MDTGQLRVVGTGLFFLFILLSGFVLSKYGRPLNTIVFAIHKLVSVAMVVFLVRTFLQVNQAVDLGATQITAFVVTGLIFLSTVVAGSLLSFDKPMPAAVLTMHQITPFLTILSTAVTLYLLPAY